MAAAGALLCIRRPNVGAGSTWPWNFRRITEFPPRRREVYANVNSGDCVQTGWLDSARFSDTVNLDLEKDE